MACFRCLMKSELLLIEKFSLPLAYLLKNPPANGKQGLLPAEMSRALLTNKEQGKNYLLHAAHIINTTLFRIYQKKYIYFNGKSVKNLKTSPRLLIGPNLSCTCQQRSSPFNLGRIYYTAVRTKNMSQRIFMYQYHLLAKLTRSRLFNTDTTRSVIPIVRQYRKGIVYCL